MDPGEPTGTGISHDVAVLVLRPNKPPGLDCQGAAQQRQAEILPLAAALAMEKRRGNAISEQRRREIIEHRAQHHLRLACRGALKHCDAGKALQDLVKPSLFTERPTIAVTGQPAIDKARVDGLEPRIIDAEPG